MRLEEILCNDADDVTDHRQATMPRVGWKSGVVEFDLI